MALSTELYGLKSAGTYRFEKDTPVSRTGSNPLNNVRMLVGFSKVGPFNTPVFVRNTKEFTDLFGPIDRTLEKRGSYFHRSCLAALSAGPIYCLNLLKLTNDDTVNVMKFAASATSKAQTKDPNNGSDYYYKGMYNIDTFYTPSEESLLYTVGRKYEYIPYDGSDESVSTNELLTFTNIGKNPVSVIVTKASDYNTTNYQVTCQEWYGKGNVPEYLDETSLISDFMVDVYVISGNWGGDFTKDEPYKRFASDVKFAKYFNKGGGLIRRKRDTDTTDTMFAQFLNEPDVQLIGKYTGCLIPGFIDKKGNNIYIEYLVNSDTSVNGLMCAVNEDVFTGEYKIDGDMQGIDLVGNSIYDVTDEYGIEKLNFLSYSGRISGDITSDTNATTGTTKYVAFTPAAEATQGSPQVTDPDNPSVVITPAVPPTAATKPTFAITAKAFTADAAAITKGGTLEVIDFGADLTSGTSSKGAVTVYGYYFGEDANGYVAPEGVDAKINDYEKIYNTVANGEVAYMVVNGKVFPVTSATKGTINGLHDAQDGNSFPLKEDGTKYQTTGTTPANKALDVFITEKYADSTNPCTPAVIATNPIVKYRFTLEYNIDPAFTAQSGTYTPITPSGYYLPKDFDVISNVKVGSNTNELIFAQGNAVYKSGDSISTNDQLAYSTLTSGEWNDPAFKLFDINWKKPTDDQKVQTLGTADIVNSKYYIDYVTAMFFNADGERTDLGIDVETNTAMECFDANHGLVGLDESGTTPVGTPIKDMLNIILRTGNLENTITVANLDSYNYELQDNQFALPIEDEDGDYKNVIVGNYILSKDGKRLSRIINITKVEVVEGVFYRIVTCQSDIRVDTAEGENGTTYTVELFTKLADWFRYYNVYALNGFQLKASHQPDGTNERQHEILDLLDEESEDCNLFKALTDREIIQFRYLVDTFGFGIEEHCKAQYTKLCQERKSAFAIINAPSCNDFKNSEDPSFVDRNKAVSAEFIAKGGDPDSNPSFLFSLPDIVNGASWGAYYYPYLKVYSNYATLLIPPAAYVSNNFVEKYSTGTPWALVAGERRGVVSGNGVVGVETTIVRDNRDWLEPAGINAIIYRNGIGCEIYANKTAKQTPQSALSSINCREACIYIQDGVERILENYLFEVNTPQTRMEIKTLVDNFMDTVKDNNGVYDYKTIMDESNNDAETIDRNMGVIDIYVEPVRGLEILVQRLTILKTGAIASGNFE